MVARFSRLLALVLIGALASEASAAPPSETRPFQLSVTVDFPDDVREGPYDAARLDAMMAAIRDLGARRVNWLYYGGTAPDDPGRGNIWNSYWDTYGLRTIASLGEPLRAAVRSAHAHGLEIWGVLKPYNGGIAGSFPTGAPAPSGRSKLTKIGGRIQQVIPFLEEHPEMRLQRRPLTDRSRTTGPIAEIRLTKSDDRPTRLRPELMRIWVSEDNYRYRQLPITPHGSVGVERADREVRDYYGNLLTRAGDPVRVVRLTGLHLTARYVVLTTTCADGRGDFRNTPLGMVEVFGEGGRRLEFVLATHAAVWIQPRDFRSYGLEYDLGYGHVPFTLDAPWQAPKTDFSRSLAGADDFDQDALFGRGPPGGFVGIALGKNAYLAAAPCEAYPEVRRLWLGWVRAMLEDGVDGVDLRISAHGSLSDEPEAYGYNPPVLTAYRARYGNAPVEPAKLAAVRGDIYTDFMREASALVRGRQRKLRVHLEAEAFRPHPVFGQLNGLPANIDFQWRRWIEEGLVDEAILRTSWFEATEDPLGKSTNRSRLDRALADPVAADMVVVASAHHLPMALNRYIGRAAGLSEYLDDLGQVARDRRFTEFDVYEFDGLARADPAKPGLIPVDGRIQGLKARWSALQRDEALNR